MRRSWSWASLLLLLLADAAQAGPARLGHRSPDHTRHTQSLTAHSLLQTQADAVKVAVVNLVGFHNEVYTALLWSFQQAGGNVTAFVDTLSTWDIEQVLTGWYPKRFQPHADFLEQACDYPIVVIATFPEHHTKILKAVRDKKCPGQRFVLMIHNPDVLFAPPSIDIPVPPLISAADCHFLALAPHTVAATKANLQRLKVPAPVSLFVPIFPISLDCSQQEKRNGVACDGAERKGFVLQGLFQTHRRNYDSVFRGILDTPALWNSSSFRLSLIGKGQDVSVPDALKDKVQMHRSLPYGAYYRMVRDSYAVLPAFASDIYYTKKSSSSVAASVVCGTPLIADSKLLHAYPYLTEESVYFTSPQESDIAAMVRILQMSQKEIDARTAEVARLQQLIYSENEQVTSGILATTVQAQARRARHS